MAAKTISLREIARFEGISYPSAARLAKHYGWRIVRPANRTLGIPALYDYHAVQADLRDRDKAAA